MPDFDLLEAVQPSSGWFCVLGLKDGMGPRQRIVATRKEANQAVEDFDTRGYNTFFGVAKFETDANRTKDNVKALKSFWLDIDCGEAKARVNAKTGRPDGYPTQTDGLLALQGFCNLVGLPKPILVNSGRGIHVYWALTEEVTRAQWEPVAARLQQLCITHKLYIDPACFEVARVLRVPGTYNYKDDPPALVTVISEAPPVDFVHLCSLLNFEAAPVAAAPRVKRELSEFAKAMQDNNMSSFAKIMRRSGSGNGCAQLADSYLHRAEISEPRWFDALSVAKFCSDQERAIHQISEGYEGYDPDVTVAKIKHIVGPHTCDMFERNNPGGCDGCPFKGKIKSPIVLGRDIKEATPKDHVVTVEADEDGTAAKTYTIPEYPEPYFRGANGGIYRRSENEENPPLLVYQRDVYVVKRLRDPIDKDVVMLRYHSPADGVKEFVVANRKATDPVELRKILADEGVMCGTKRFTMLIDCLQIAIHEIQECGRIEQMRLQFGWAEADSKFVIGDREITKDGVFHSPPSTVTSALAEYMQPKGTMEKWKEVFNLYGRPGLEAHAFAALSAFGAPLLKFMGQNGAIINVIHPSSGTGKTTILHMCNSVYGTPDRLCAVQKDTFNGKVLRLGVMNNLPFTIDEMTNTTPAEFSELAYNMSQGRGKDRMKTHSNELRANLTSWRTISLCSSNASFYEKMATMKASPDGELMRLLEYKIEFTKAIDQEEGKQMFDHQLMENYGHAGDIYAAWLIKNVEEAKTTALGIQVKIDRELKLTQRERFWSAVLAANITGGLIAKHLGLIDWDMKAIYKWITTKVREMRMEVEAPLADVSAVVGDYINRHIQNVLVVNDGVDSRTNMAFAPVVEPRGDLLIRYEPDTKQMFIPAKQFKADCVKLQINYRETIKRLEDKGILTGTTVKRLSKGMKIAAPGVYCLVFDCDNNDFINMSDFVQTGAPDESGESQL